MFYAFCDNGKLFFRNNTEMLFDLQKKKYRRRVSEKTKSYVVPEHLGENFAFEHVFEVFVI